MRRLILGLSATLAAATAFAADLTVTVTGVRVAKGEIIVRLFASKNGFPSDRARAKAEASAPAGMSPVVVSFKDVPPGRYALIAIHDENGDKAMEKALLGLPEEGYGVSNNPDPLLVPRFDDGVFALADGANAIEVRLVYY